LLPPDLIIPRKLRSLRRRALGYDGFAGIPLPARDLHPCHAVETILCAVDFSPSSPETLACAAGLARALRTGMEIVHVVRPPRTLLTDGPPSLLVKDLQEQAERELTPLAAALTEQDVKVTTSVQVGHAEDGVLARAAELRANLIVVGAHARVTGVRSFLGSVAERIVRAAPCPVLVIPPGAHALAAWTPGNRPLRITGAIDSSQASDSCLDFLRRLAQRIRLDLHLIHLYWPIREHQRLGLDPPDPFEADPEAVAVLSRDLQSHILEHLGNEQASLRVRPSWGTEDNGLAWEAETDGADVLVVGTSQDRHGSTAIHTIRTSQVPVLCVPSRLASAHHPSLTRIRHVLATTDFSPAANAALSEAYRLVLGGGVVTLVNVNEEAPMTLTPDRKAEIETCLLALIPSGVNPHTIRTRVFVAEGRSPAEAIVQAVNRIGPDVVVMASHGRSGLSRAVRGSVAEHVLRMSPIPVLIVPQGASTDGTARN
jgi:nucleotide-binding universal stress UspA family protein